jgi:hypothetical protein
MTAQAHTPSLQALQHCFLSNLLRLEQNSLVRANISTAHIDSIAMYLEPMSSARFDVYRNNIRIGRIKTLTAIYPICQRLVGEDFFQGLASHYCQQIQSISNSTNLNDYGESFSEFIAQFPPLNQLPELAYLSEMAGLEWIVHRTLIGPSNTVFNFKAFADLNLQQQEKVIFKLAQNGYLYFSQFPIDLIWTMNQLPEPEALNLNDYHEPRYLFIYRLGWEDICIKQLTLPEWTLLNTIQKGLTVEQMYKIYQCKKSQSLSEQASAENVINTIASLIQRGCITDFAIQP